MKPSSPFALLAAAAAAAVTVAPTLSAAQLIRTSPKGCILDLSGPVSRDIPCGRPNTVHFAVEWYGADVQELQSWLRVAGCADEEATRTALWAADMCRGRSGSSSSSSSRRIGGGAGAGGENEGGGGAKLGMMVSGRPTVLQGQKKKQPSGEADADADGTGFELRRR